jgi:hypothetical protein
VTNPSLVSIELRHRDVASGDITAEATDASPIVSRITFAVEWSLTPFDSVRVDAREVENRRTGCPRNHPRAKWS